MSRRDTLREIAKTTLAAVERGYYTSPPDKTRIELKSSIAKCKLGTQFFAQNSSLSEWKTSPPNTSAGITHAPEVSILEISSIEGVRFLHDSHDTSSGPAPRVGLLNFASATKPGGGFINGAQAQEESLARSSTLYPSLMFPPAQRFYTDHKKNLKGGYYTHAMIYSPGVTFFRDDSGGWTAPCNADVLTSAAVNAGVARKTIFGQEHQIEKAMRERMARVLYAFEREGVRHCVLGSFGTGVFQNDVGMVARIWADLLVAPHARFCRSFDKVVFAILGRQTFDDFKLAFEDREMETAMSVTTIE